MLKQNKDKGRKTFSIHENKKKRSGSMFVCFKAFKELKVGFYYYQYYFYNYYYYIQKRQQQSMFKSVRVFFQIQIFFFYIYVIL